MKRAFWRARLLALVLAVAGIGCCWAATQPQPTEKVQPAAGKKQKAGQAQPTAGKELLLGGELSNSAATSEEDIVAVMSRMREAGLKLLLVPVSWDLLEPEEGRFDFRLVDCMLSQARSNGQRLVLLWFGAWKNSMSCYAPMWVKRDVKRFPRAMTRSGKPLEILSAFSEEVLQADLRAFTALMRHLRDADAGTGTVAMVQVENEVGMLEDARDHSPLAEKAFKAWKASPSAYKGRGGELAEDEAFTAYHYARYIERLASEGKKIYDVPMYVNAALNSRGRKPGEYPSGGPLAHLAGIWNEAAPSIDMLSPDIYDEGFKSWAAQYDFDGNRLFIPESRCCMNSGVRALYVVGEHGAVGFCPFAVDRGSEAELKELRRGYELLEELMKLQGKPAAQGQAMRGVLLDETEKTTTLDFGDVQLRCSHYLTLPWDSRGKDGSTWREGGAVIVRLAKEEFLIAGSGVVVEFSSGSSNGKGSGTMLLGEDGFALEGDKALQEGQESRSRSVMPLTEQQRGKKEQYEGHQIGLGTVDEVRAGGGGKMEYVRRLNGDETHQGRHVRISIDDYQLLHVRLYEY